MDGRGTLRARVDEIETGMWVETVYDIALVERVQTTKRLDTVFNFAVSETQSYFADGAWVHNCAIEIVRKVQELSKDARLTMNEKLVLQHSEKFTGVSEKVAGDRIHKIKKNADLRPDDNVVMDMSGTVFHPTQGHRLDTLTNKNLCIEQ